LQPGADMTTLIDILFLLIAATGGSLAMGLICLLRAPAKVDPVESDEARFARESLARLQDLARRVASEVDHHAECVEEITAQLANDDNDEEAVIAAVSQLVDANRRMQRQLDTAEQRLEAQAAQIESHAAEARTDALTKVANRRAFDDELSRCLARFRDDATPVTLILLDVDHFKRFNDSYGHQTGDDALRTVARTLRQVVDGAGLVARYGGEEFGVVLADNEAAEASQLCEKIRQAIEATPVRAANRELRITASAGVAQIMANECEKDLIARADQSLYASKKAGRNCGHLHDGRMSRLIRFQEAVAAALQPTADRGVGDEWMYSTESENEAVYREPLANVSSRPAFFDELIRRLSQCKTSSTSLTLILIQVDDYDRIFCERGSSAVAVVLRIMSQFITASLRDMDSVSRLSDDTFAVLLPGAVLDDGLTIAQRLRQAVERCHLPRKAGVKFFTLSAGVVQAIEGDDLRQILERARALLNEAANQGRNCVVGEDATAVQAATAAAPTA
jgi:diguanylate cyclase